MTTSRKEAAGRVLHPSISSTRSFSSYPQTFPRLSAPSSSPFTWPLLHSISPSVSSHGTASFSVSSTSLRYSNPSSSLQQYVCPKADNSLLGICFVFSPAMVAIVPTTALIVQAALRDVVGSEKNSRRVLSVAYVFGLMASLIQFSIVLNFAGTAMREDSAYSGPINRCLC